MNYQKINKCRVCYSGRLKEMGSLGNIAINDFTNKPSNGKQCPLTLVRCQKCDLTQLLHNPPSEEMYKKFYWYKSGINPVIVRDLKEIVRIISRKIKGGCWVDIGANDGTLLKFVSKKKFYRIAVEPATNYKQELIECCEQIEWDFWENVSLGQEFGENITIGVNAEVITAIGNFYDSPNPNLFIANVKKHLAENGLFVAQLMTLKQMLENNDVGNICHEHLEYYNYKSLVYLFEKNGLEIFKVEENNINGGSYRLFARHYKNGSIDYPEPEYDFDRFFEVIEVNKRGTIEVIKQLTQTGLNVYGYGASTKGNTILQYYGLTKKFIKGIADANPEKIGKFTIGSKIPIVSEDEARKNADYFFILPYAFLKTFIKREKKWKKNKRHHFIVSIPFLLKL